MIPTDAAATIENISASKKVRRVLGLDLHSWELVMLWSLGIAAIAAFAVVVSTAAVVRLQKEESAESKHDLEMYKLNAGEKISAADAAGETARAEVEKAHGEIAKASAETAKANERTAELQLALEREIGARQPRSVTPDQYQKLVKSLAPAPKGRVIVKPISWIWKLPNLRTRLREPLGTQVFPELEMRP